MKKVSEDERCLRLTPLAKFLQSCAVMLQVENLHKSFGAVKAVNQVHFDVQRGEVVGLLGPNGAGKTTTMRLVTGFLKPDAGTISLDGISVIENPTEARKKIGYLPEHAPSYPDMEVTEFLRYILRLRKVDSSQHSGLLRQAIELCGLKEVVGRPIGQLSKGFRQRVGLAQALIHQPPLLILDEPTSGLDPHQIQEIRNLIKEIGKERTVILSTHIMQEVQAVCQRALIIAKGKLVGSGTLAELTQQRQGVARYIAKIKASRQELAAQAAQLPGLTLETSQAAANGTWLQVVLTSEQTTDQSETIFQWVVKNNWSLSELRREMTSLEDVFLELTKT